MAVIAHSFLSHKYNSNFRHRNRATPIFFWLLITIKEIQLFLHTALCLYQRMIVRQLNFRRKKIDFNPKHIPLLDGAILRLTIRASRNGKYKFKTKSVVTGNGKKSYRRYRESLLLAPGPRAV